MYSQILNIVNYIIIGLMCLSLVLMCVKIVAHIYGLMPAVKLPEAKSEHKFAILIPARNESHVINNLLQSLKDQKYPKDKYDIYVIIEREDDPTNEICKQYENTHVFVRPNLDVKTKGAALDQTLKYLLENNIAKEKGYEAYFVFDADNIVAPNFLHEMNKTYDAGYELAMSYRNSSNWNGGWIASCSALTFSMVNTFENKFRAKFSQKVIVSGTGFFIAHRVIEELGGYPFYSLTEDMELSSFAALNNIKGAYNENTEIFDEQPENFKLQWNQRVRWVKGHMQVGKKYNKLILKEFFRSREQRLGKLEFALNIVPVAVPVCSVLLYAITCLVLGIVGASLQVDKALWIQAFIQFGIANVGTYLFLMFYTLAILLAEKKHCNITPKNAFITVLANPFFMALWLPIGVFAMFKKQVSWKVIEHSGASQKDPNLSI